MARSPLPPPFMIKMVRHIRLIPEHKRKKTMQKAGYNTFHLRSKDIFIDLLTDSGTSAMSDYQWAGIMLGDEAYAGSENFYNLEAAIKDIYGMPYFIPTHQGRGAEHIASIVYLLHAKRGPYVFSNMYFTTSRVHVEQQGGVWIDVIIPEAHDPLSGHPFKGNIDVEKLQKQINKVGHTNVGFVRMEANCNMAGGQPFSMQNLREVRDITKRYRIPLLIDATRALENAYFIKKREKIYSTKCIRTIFREMMDNADTITVSSKKDNLVNIGGFLATRDEQFIKGATLIEKCMEECTVYEGLHTYGGLAGRDLEALARGIYEMLQDEKYIKHRVQQVEYLGQLLLEKEVPIVLPIGGHAVYLDAKRFLPHIPQTHYTAQALAAAIYEKCGVRSMERGIVSAGRDPRTKKEHVPELELVRLAIPRRVYMDSHLAFAAEHIAGLFHENKTVKGLRMVYEPEKLRFFQARFERI